MVMFDPTDPYKESDDICMCQCHHVGGNPKCPPSEHHDPLVPDYVNDLVDSCCKLAGHKYIEDGVIDLDALEETKLLVAQKIQELCRKLSGVKNDPTFSSSDLYRGKS